MQSLSGDFRALLFIGLAATISALNCPNGFLVYHNACVQAVKECPPNLVWQDGICLAPAENPVNNNGAAQNTAVQTVPCTSNCPQCQGQTNSLCPNNTPCSQATPCTAVQPCTNTQTSTPCQVNQPYVAATPCSSCAQTTTCTVIQTCVNNPSAAPCVGNQPCVNNAPCTTNQPCPNTPSAAPCATNKPCVNNPSAAPCVQNQPCNNNPPCVTNQQGTPCITNQPCNQSPQPTPCGQNPPSVQPPPVQPPPVQPPPVQPPPVLPPPVQPPSVKPTPPGEIKLKCPPGTVLIDDVCRLIGCGKWFIYMNGDCVRVECVEGTFWNGQECVESETKEFNINFKNTITTQIDRHEPAIIIDGVNNLNVTVVNTASDDCDAEYCADDNVTETDDYDMKKGPKKEKCCIVITPRICEPKIVGDQKSWKCYSRRYKRCGDMCIAPTILLKAPEAVERPNAMVLPPMETTYVPQQHQQQPIEYPVSRPAPLIGSSYDCSGCVSGQAQYCAPYCQRSVCPPKTCQYYDQRQYCLEYPGQNGCQERDGCYSDWCSSGAEYF